MDILEVLSRHMESALAELAADPETINTLKQAGEVTFALDRALEGIDADAMTEDDRALAAAVTSAYDGVKARRAQLTAAGTAFSRRTATPPARPALGDVRGNRPQRTPDKDFTGEGGASLVASSGETITDAEQMAKQLEKAHRLAGRNGGATVLAFSRRREYPAERTLTGDPLADMARVEAVAGEQAIVASGGVCNPVDVDFSVPTWADDSRPLRDALVPFAATRGGLRFLQTSTFAGVGSSATKVWSESLDANPGTVVKAKQVLTCGTEIEVFVDAVPTRVQVGNMGGTFFPELVAGLMVNIQANAARIAELNLLSKIDAASTTVSTGVLLGATRDLLATYDQAAAAMRYRNRIARGVQLRLAVPAWVRDIIKADLTRSLAHGEDHSLSLSDADVDEMLSARGLTPIWLADGEAAGTANGVAFATQGWGAQTSGALLPWPANVVSYMFPEGSWIFLDGGSLDVGIVRDSTLNATNDYEIFTEVFEGVAARGVESLQLVTTVKANGESASSASTSAY